MSVPRQSWLPIILGGVGSLVGATALIGWLAVLTDLRQWWGFGLIAAIGVCVVLGILALLWRLLRVAPLGRREWRIVVSVVVGVMLVAAVVSFLLVTRYS